MTQSKTKLGFMGTWSMAVGGMVGGADALYGIKEAGGITIAQKLLTARQPDFQHASLPTGQQCKCSYIQLFRL